MKINTLVMLTAVTLVTLCGRSATVGYFTDNNPSSTGPASAIIAAGHTPVQIANIGTFNLNTVSLLMVNESSNSGLSAPMLGRLTDVFNWVNGGGLLMVHDRFVGVTAGTPYANPFLVGSGGTLTTRSFVNDNNIDLTAAGAAVFPSLNNLSLDGGNSSSHGFAGSGLPGGATSLLSIGGNPSQVVSFTYSVGAGRVYYSTIPLDYYLSGSGNNPPRDNLNNVYTPTAINHMLTSVPEPTTAALALLGMGALFVTRRKMRG